MTGALLGQGTPLLAYHSQVEGQGPVLRLPEIGHLHGTRHRCPKGCQQVQQHAMRLANQGNDQTKLRQDLGFRLGDGLFDIAEIRPGHQQAVKMEADVSWDAPTFFGDNV